MFFENVFFGREFRAYAATVSPVTEMLLGDMFEPCFPTIEILITVIIATDQRVIVGKTGATHGGNRLHLGEKLWKY